MLPHFSLRFRVLLIKTNNLVYNSAKSYNMTLTVLEVVVIYKDEKMTIFWHLPPSPEVRGHFQPPFPIQKWITLIIAIDMQVLQKWHFLQKIMVFANYLKNVLGAALFLFHILLGLIFLHILVYDMTKFEEIFFNIGFFS